MSVNENISQVPQSSKFGALNSLANNPLAADPNESQQPEPSSNEIMTNIIKDASKITSDNDHQKNGINKESDFQSESITPDDNENSVRRKSITSGRLTDDQANSSTPALIDPPSNNTIEVPVRSMSESVLVDHQNLNERSSPLPIQQDESSSDVDGFFNSKTTKINDSQQPNGLDKTTRSGTASPKLPTSRVQSASRKRSPSPFGNEKRVQLSDKTGSDTDRDNQEATTVIPRPSSSNRPQSPFVGEQAKPSSRITSPQTTKEDTNVLIVDQSSPRKPGEEEEEEQKGSFELSTSLISSTSRRGSANKIDQEQRSRPTSATKSKLDDNSYKPSTSRPNSNRPGDFSSTNEQSKLIKPGEQLQIPVNDADNAPIGSPPPTPSGIKQMVLINPLLDETNLKSSISSSMSNEKIIDGDVVSSKSRRNSNISGRQQTTDKKPPSRKASNASEQKPISRQSLSDQQEQKPSSKASSRKASLTEQQRISSRRESEQQINTNRDNELSSPRRSNIVNASSSQQSSRRSSTKKQEQPNPVTANKDSSRRSSTDADALRRTSANEKQEGISSTDKRQSPLQTRSGQQSKRNSTSKADEIVVIDSTKSQQQNEKRLSTTDSDGEHLNTSTSPRVKSSSQEEKAHHADVKQLSSSQATTPTGDDGSSHWTKQIQIPQLHSTDDESQTLRDTQVRPQSSNVEQIAERNKNSASNSQKKKEKHRPLRRSASAESLNHIPIVDDKSLDSASGNNTEFEEKKQKRVKSKKKDVETNTDRTTDSKQSTNESTPQKSLKATKPISDDLHSKRRRSPTKEQTSTTPDSEGHSVRRSGKQSKDSNEDKDPVNVNVTVSFVKDMTDGTSEATAKQKSQKLFFRPENQEQSERKKFNKKQLIKSSTDYERNTQSDTEQIITEKQKKRRRPKRISRTTQTYERIFRQMGHEEHKELLPINDTDKNIQTRKSQLRPRTKSPRKHLPIYLSTKAFKIEEILPKQFPQSGQNISKTSVVARSVSPQGGKLLILRPSLPFHHTDAVNVQRISLQYSIDLIPNNSVSDQRNKSNVPKQVEQTNNLPTIRSSFSTVNNPTNKSNPKEKSVSNRNEDRTYQRKNGGAV